MKALVIIDAQKDFMNSDGKLYVPGAEDIKENIKKLVEYAENNHMEILITMDYHMKNDPEFKTFPPHCICGTEGAKLIPEAESTKSMLFTKATYNIFDEILGNKLFQDHLIKNEIKEVIVAGVATDYCVKDAVMGMLKMGIHVDIVIDAIAGVNEKTSIVAMNEMMNAKADFIGLDGVR